jgi:hypothetical protein
VPRCQAWVNAPLPLAKAKGTDFDVDGWMTSRRIRVGQVFAHDTIH